MHSPAPSSLRLERGILTRLGAFGNVPPNPLKNQNFGLEPLVPNLVP
jgi:hypothetical protein